MKERARSQLLDSQQIVIGCMGKDHRKTAGGEGVLTQGRVGLAALAEHHEQGMGIERLSHGANGVDGVAGLFRIDDTGLGNAGEGCMNGFFEFGARGPGGQQFLRHGGKRADLRCLPCLRGRRLRRERARVWGGGRWGLEVESSGGIDAQVRNSRAAQFLDLLVGSNQERVTHEGRSKPGHVKFGDMHADSKRVNCNGSVCHNACWSPAGDIQAEIIQPSYRLRP